MGKVEFGSYTNKITVNKAKDITGVIDIKAGKNHAVILKSTGEVYVTGSNLYGELGQNDTSIRKVKEFTKVEGLRKIIAIGAGDSTVTVLNKQGEVYAWGSNIYGELGIESNNVIEIAPKKVEALSDIRYLSGGKNYNAVLNKQGEIFICGVNNHGELGIGTKTNENTYKKLEGINEIIDIDLRKYLYYNGKKRWNSLGKWRLFSWRPRYKKQNKKYNTCSSRK